MKPVDKELNMLDLNEALAKLKTFKILQIENDQLRAENEKLCREVSRLRKEKADYRMLKLSRQKAGELEYLKQFFIGGGRGIERT